MSLLSVMLQSGMPLEQVRANIKLTISGGQNEPRDAIASGYMPYSPPRSAALVLNGDATWMDVFEEYCRWVANLHVTSASSPTHNYHGITFEPDERIMFMFGSANHDESFFSAA